MSAGSTEAGAQQRLREWQKNRQGDGRSRGLGEGVGCLPPGVCLGAAARVLPRRTAFLVADWRWTGALHARPPHTTRWCRRGILLARIPGLPGCSTESGPASPWKHCACWSPDLPLIHPSVCLSVRCPSSGLLPLPLGTWQQGGLQWGSLPELTVCVGVSHSLQDDRVLPKAAPAFPGSLELLGQGCPWLPVCPAAVCLLAPRAR